MTHLTIYPDTDPNTVLLDTRDGGEIAQACGRAGARFAILRRRSKA